MPARRVGRDCWQWGHHGKVYCGPGARDKAERQGRATHVRGYEAREGELSELDRQLLDAYNVSGDVGSIDDIGMPAGLVASQLGLSTAAVTRATKRLAGMGLIEDTGYAMKLERSKIGRGSSWQWIDRPKGERGMLTKPGASTVWRTTRAGVDVLERPVHGVEEGPDSMPDDLPDAAICIVVDAAGRVLTVSRPEPPHELAIPGGLVDPGEVPAQAAVRELAEECGVTVRAIAHAAHLQSPTDGRRVHVFRAHSHAGHAYAAEPRTRVAWLAPQDLLAQARRFRPTVRELLDAGLLGPHARRR